MYNNNYSDIIRSPRYTNPNNYPNNYSNTTSIRSPRYTNPNNYPNNYSDIIRSPRNPNTTSIRSPRYTIPDNYHNNYHNNYSDIIRSPRYTNTNIYSPIDTNTNNINTYSDLPENWSEHISHSGRPYYYDVTTGVSQWQHPTINSYLPQPQTDLHDLQLQVFRTLGLA